MVSTLLEACPRGMETANMASQFRHVSELSLVLATSMAGGYHVAGLCTVYCPAQIIIMSSRIFFAHFKSLSSSHLKPHHHFNFKTTRLGVLGDTLLSFFIQTSIELTTSVLLVLFLCGNF